MVKRGAKQAIVVDAAGAPIPDCPYRLRLADGTVRRARSDAQGKVDLSGAAAGSRVMVDRCIRERPRLFGRRMGGAQR